MSEYDRRYTYNFPTHIRFGPGVIDEVAQKLKDEGIRNPLVVVDPILGEMEIFKDFVERLKSESVYPHVFKQIDKNPVKKNVLSGAEEYNLGNCEGIVAFGGGASIDTARAIALKAHHSQDLFVFDDALGGDRLVVEKIPYFIAIPTTSGTGSEVGRSTVIADDYTREKKVLFSPRLIPSAVFMDPLLTMGLPKHVTAATGIDAFSHNLEAFMSPGFNPLCDGIALEGIRLVGESLEKAVHSPDLKSRSDMMLASMMGATAFQKGLGIIHSLAHPISTVFDLHHGLSISAMLKHGSLFNKKVGQDRYSRVAGALGLKPKSKNFFSWIEGTLESIGLPQDISHLNPSKEQLKRLSKLAFKDGCHGGNVRPVKEKDFLNIYKKAAKI